MRLFRGLLKLIIGILAGIIFVISLVIDAGSWLIEKIMGGLDWAVTKLEAWE
jgi:hypothetical protein